MHYSSQHFFKHNSVLVGIDEAGRGPLAGPVAVGVVALLREFDTSIFQGIRDSKQLSEKKRNHFMRCMNTLTQEQVLKYHVSFSSAQIIDRFGIVPAIERALAQSLTCLHLTPERTMVLLDGSLKAPKNFANQKTIIKGDETELPITLAGIAAKVTRDREMLQLANAHPHYGFERHKGYGTQFHRDMIRQHGITEAHRSSFVHLT